MRKGKFIQVYSGRRFWPLDPNPDEITIEDIAHALSNQCRFSGHVEHFYSVAQHSVYVAAFCENKLAGLMHDASEAYLVDVPRPIKPEFPAYAEIEKNIMRIIAEKYGFEFPLPEDVVLADNQMLWVEKRELLKPNVDWYQDTAIELSDKQKTMKIEYISPVLAESIFLKTFYQLASAQK